MSLYVTNTFESKAVEEAVKNFKSREYFVIVHTDYQWGIYVVVAQSGCEQELQVFLKEKLLHTAYDNYPAAFSSPALALAETIATLFNGKF